jgi:hypothetical protein
MAPPKQESKLKRQRSLDSGITSHKEAQEDTRMERWMIARLKYKV